MKKNRKPSAIQHRSSGILISLPRKAQVANGTVLYALDYFVHARHEARVMDTTLVLYGWSDEQVIELDKLCTERYGECLMLQGPVELIDDQDELMWYHFDELMMNAFDYELLKKTLSAKRVWVTHSHTSMSIGEVELWHDGTILNECPVIGPVNYIKKMSLSAMDTYAELEWCRTAYVNLSGWRYVDADGFKEVEKLCDDRHIIVHGDDFHDYSYVEERGWSLVKGHVPRLHELFDTLIYYVKDEYDYAPRMLVECAYLGKQIIAHCENGLDDGFARRWNDILTGHDRIVERYSLTNDDVVIRHFVRARELMEQEDAA